MNTDARRDRFGWLLGATFLLSVAAAWLALGLLLPAWAEPTPTAVPMDQVEIQRSPTKAPVLRFTDQKTPSVVACHAFATASDARTVEALAADTRVWDPPSHQLLRDLTATTNVPAAAWTRPTLVAYDGNRTLVLRVDADQSVTRVMATRDDAEALARLLARAGAVTSATWWIDEYPPHAMAFRFDLGAPQAACW
jgi:hypothetical protein